MAPENSYSKPEPYSPPETSIRVETQVGIETPREKIVRKPLPVIPVKRMNLKGNSTFV